MATSFIIVFVLCFVETKIAMFGFVFSSIPFVKLIFWPDYHWIFIGTSRKYYELLMEENKKIMERVNKKQNP